MIGQREMIEVTYVVPAIACDRCEDAVSSRLLAISGVEAVGVDLETRSLTVYGEGLDLGTLRASIENAGLEAA
jgi:copper chaperone